MVVCDRQAAPHERTDECVNPKAWPARDLRQRLLNNQYPGNRTA